MESKYLVKVTETATEKNKTYKGAQQIFFYGKGGCTVGCMGYFSQMAKEMYYREILANGYDRLSDAKRSYAYKHAKDDTIGGGSTWEKEVEIVRFDI